MKKLLFATTALLALTTAAAADDIKFFSGTTQYGAAADPFSEPGSVYSLIENLGTACISPVATTGCDGRADITTAIQQYGPRLTVTAGAGQNVTADTQPNFGGLGVLGATTNDNIDGLDVLTFTFSGPVRLIGVSTLFDSADHGPFNIANVTENDIGPRTFLLNGAEVSFLAANLDRLNLIGNVFSFSQHAGDPSFYVSGLEFVAVPGPIVGAGLPGVLAMFGAGGWFWKRRKTVG